MPTAGWLRRTDLPVDAAGRSYIDPPNLDQILDQFANWRAAVNGGGQTLSNVSVNTTGTMTIGGVINNGNNTIQSASPQMIWKETDAVLDSKIWRMYAEGAVMVMDLINDAFSAATPFLAFRRTAMVAAGFDVYAPLKVLSDATGQQLTLSSAGGTATYQMGRDSVSSGLLFITGNQNDLSGYCLRLTTGNAVRTVMQLDPFNSRLWISGALKVLSVDGNGFVKAA